jgi:hypothetical protein
MDDANVESVVAKSIGFDGGMRNNQGGSSIEPKRTKGAVDHAT